MLGETLGVRRERDATRCVKSHIERRSRNLGRWRDIEALFTALGAEISEREGPRVEVFLFGEVRVYHRPHPRRTPTKARWQASANG